LINIISVKEKFVEKRSFFPKYINSTIPFNSIYERKGQLLNEHSNTSIYKYADTAQLLNKGRKSRKKAPNIIKLSKNIQPNLKP
jgi:hypothetical protein